MNGLQFFPTPRRFPMIRRFEFVEGSSSKFYEV